MGIALTYGISYYGRGQLSTSNYISYVKHESLGSDLLNASLNYALSVKELHAKLINNFTDYPKMKRRYVKRNRDEMGRWGKELKVKKKTFLTFV